MIITPMTFKAEVRGNPIECRINEDKQRDDDKAVTYEAYDICEVI